MNMTRARILQVLTAFLTMIVLILAAWGLSRFKIATDQTIFFSETDPERALYKRAEQQFGDESTITFIVGASDANIWTEEGLEALRWLTEAASSIPNVYRTTSLVTFQRTSIDPESPDDLIVEDWIPQDATLTSEFIAARRAEATTDPRIVGLLVSEDGAAAAIGLDFDRRRTSDAEMQDMYERSKELSADFRRKFPSLELYLSGLLTIDQNFQQASLQDARLNLAMIALVALLSFILWRSVLLASLVVVLSAAAATATLGLAGWLGYPMTPVLAVSPLVVMSMYVVNVVHLVHAYATHRAHSKGKVAAFEALAETFRPITFASVATIFGFATLNFSDAPPFRQFGNIVCLGVGLAWLMSVSLTPLALKWVKPHSTFLYEWAKSLSRLAVVFAAARPVARYGVFGITIACATALGFAASKNFSIDDRFVEFFSPSFEIRRASDFASERLVGSYFVDFVIDMERESGVIDPDVLRKTDQFCDWLRDRSDVKFARCLTDSLKDLNMKTNGGATDRYRIPSDPNLVAQLVLMLELALPLGQDIGNQLTIDKSALRVTAFTPDISAQELLRLKAEGEAYLQNADIEVASTFGTGLSVMFALVSQNTIKGMTLGTILEILAITFTMVVLLRSIRLGLLTLVANVVPIVIGYAIWALLVERFGMTASVCGAISIGILVDDTIHLMMRYQSEIKSGLIPNDAITRALDTSGTAIVITSLVLASGFLMLGLSDFAVTWTLGYLSALILVTGMAAQLFVLPSLMLAISRDRLGRIKVRDAVAQVRK